MFLCCSLPSPPGADNKRFFLPSAPEAALLTECFREYASSSMPRSRLSVRSISLSLSAHGFRRFIV